MLGGKWTYRSYLNRTDLVGDDAALALALIFGEGVFDLHQNGEEVQGALGMGTGYALTITGGARAASPDTAASFHMSGLGVAGTATAGWRYDYRGIVSHSWPEAIDQVPCLVGTVVRVNAHGPTSPAGVTASFVAVRHDDDPPARAGRHFALLNG